MNPTEFKQLIRREVKSVLSEQERFSVKGVFDAQNQLAKDSQKKLEAYQKEAEKFRKVNADFQQMLKDLHAQRKKILSDMENDPDVINDINSGRAQEYGNELNKIDQKIEPINKKIADQKDNLDLAYLEYQEASEKAKSRIADIKKMHNTKTM